MNTSLPLPIDSMFDGSYALLDCRTASDYGAAHVRHAVHIPVAELVERMYELPSIHKKLAVWVDGTGYLQAQQFFTAKNFKQVVLIKWNPILQQQLMGRDMIESGFTCKQILWQPSPHFAAALPDKPGTLLDIACGSGRQAIFAGMQGWQVTALDNNTSALGKLTALADRQGQNIETIEVDLEQRGNPFTATLGTRQFDLVCVLHYLHRPLFPFIKSLIAPGGAIFYQTFMQGCEKFGRPRNPDFLLKPNELAEVFHDFSIGQDTVAQLDDGRPIAVFWANKAKGYARPLAKQYRF